MAQQSCTLVLSTGEKIKGKLIGHPIISSGDLVFNTGMVGYSESLTDPSYYGQILVFSYPLIGNYGIPKMTEDIKGLLTAGFESRRVHVNGVVISTNSPDAFHWQSVQSLSKWLEAEGVPGIVGVDTRSLVHQIRSAQGLFGRLEPQDPKGKSPLHEGEFFDPNNINVLPKVSTPVRHLRKVSGLLSY